MNVDKKDALEHRRKKSRDKSGTSSPSRSSRASPASSDPASPKRPRKTESNQSETIWVSASAMKSPRGHKRNESGDFPPDEGDRTFAHLKQFLTTYCS
jgi:hypothetical protein